MATTFVKGTNTRLLCGVGGADSAVTVTGIAAADELMSATRITNATNGTISSILDVKSVCTVAANTVTVVGSSIDSNQLLVCLFADRDASV